MNQTMLLLAFFFLSLVIISPAFALEPLKITESASMKNVMFDGRWSDFQEWKASSYEYLIDTNGNEYNLRYAHYKDFIYVLIDVEDDTSLNMNKDFALICFDGENNKSSMFDANDYCFKIALGEKNGTSFAGNSLNNTLVITNNDPEFVGVSSISGKDNKYSNQPHGVYEFRIPIKILDRSNNYGFFLMVYDHQQNTTFTWPKEISNDSNTIPTSATWGDLVSPDNSLPEFHWTTILLFFSIIVVLTITKISKLSIFPLK